MGSVPDFDLSRRVFLLGRSKQEIVRPVGTAFGVARPGLILTSNHALKNASKTDLHVMCRADNSLLDIDVDHIVSHPEADVAALVVRPHEQIDYFRIDKPQKGFAEFPLGADVCSYGFAPMEKIIASRLMKGHIQSHFRHVEDGCGYAAFELSFPAFPGQSGSPVFNDFNRDGVMAMVTSSSSVAVAETEDEFPTAAGFWAIGASITPLVKWINSIS